MPESAKILRFPERQAQWGTVSLGDPASVARSYLDTRIENRAPEFINQCLSNADTFLSVCSALRDSCDASPSVVAEEAARLYNWLLEEGEPVGVFDERQYLLGETALIAGHASRLLGKRDDADLWLDRSEAAFRHTINPGPALSTVAYARLTLYYDRRAYGRVFELLPSLVASFQKVNMTREVFKCRFLEAVSLKECSRADEARKKLELMRLDPALKQEPRLLALTLVHLGELVAATGEHARAVELYHEAVALRTDQPLVMAHLKAVTGDALRLQGHLKEAVEAFRAAIREYAAAGMSTLVAYLRVVLSETLIALSRHREAEWEILAALPTIEEQKMVPEGFAAIALLKESVRRRKTDPHALRELREHLKAKS